MSQPQHQGQLLLLQKHGQHCHSHNIKVSYSCSRNMTSIATVTTSRSATFAPETWTALSQPQHQGRLLLLLKHDQHCQSPQHQVSYSFSTQHCHSHNIKVSYSCSRNMTNIVTATISRSALLLQKHGQHCHSHNIKVSYSCFRNMTSIVKAHNIKVSYSFSRNMNSIVTATTLRSATLVPEI